MYLPVVPLVACITGNHVMFALAASTTLALPSQLLVSHCNMEY